MIVTLIVAAAALVAIAGAYALGFKHGRTVGLTMRIDNAMPASATHTRQLRRAAARQVAKLVAIAAGKRRR